MRTRSQTRNRNRQQQSQPAVVQPIHLEEPFVNPPLVPMADNRTMAQLLQAPTEGYEDAIVIPEINANFELKHGLINLVQNKQFFGHDKEDPHPHIRSARIWLEKEPRLSILTWDDLLDTFYNALNANDQDSSNFAAGGNFLDKMPRECLRIIESKSKANDAVLRNMQNQGQGLQNQMTNLTEMLSKFITSNTASSSNSRKSTIKPNPEQNPETSMDKVQKPSLESTAQVPPPEDHDFIFIEIQEPNSPKPTSYQPKLPYPERMKKLEEIAITTVNAECSAIILNKVPEKLEDPRKFLIPCALQELDRTNALADSGASINLLPHSIYKQLGLGALKHTRMTLELANRSITHPMGIAEDVVTNQRPFLRTAKSLIDLYEEKLTLRVGSDELVFYAEKSEKSKNKQFAHAISVIDFTKDEPFSGSTTNHSDTLPPSSSPVKTSDNLEEFADELTLLKKGVQEEIFLVYSNPLFEFDDDFNSSNENPLFNEIDEDVENENSNVSNSDEPVLLNTPLSDKVECSDPEDDIDEIDAFLAMEVSSNFEEGYFDSEGDVIFLENLLSDDTTHNLAPEVISDHEPKQNESIHNTSITFSPRSDPLHHEFAGELLTLPSRIAREHEEYLSRMTLLCEISTSRSQENVHANPSSIIESLPVSLIPVEDSDPVQEEIDIFLVPDDLIPPGVENDDSEDEDNELPNLDHQDNPSSPRPPPEPPDVCLNFKPDTAMKNDEEIVLSLNVEDVNSFTFVIWTFLPFFTYPEDSPVILSLRSEDLVFDPGISTFHFSLKPVPFALPKDK
ncbi:reverse transcriptase domain-containing protein [Tanacetum coccineum]